MKELLDELWTEGVRIEPKLPKNNDNFNNNHAYAGTMQDMSTVDSVAVPEMKGLLGGLRVEGVRKRPERSAVHNVEVP